MCLESPPPSPPEFEIVKGGEPGCELPEGWVCLSPPSVLAIVVWLEELEARVARDWAKCGPAPSAVDESPSENAAAPSGSGNARKATSGDY